MPHNFFQIQKQTRYPGRGSRTNWWRNTGTVCTSSRPKQNWVGAQRLLGLNHLNSQICNKLRFLKSMAGEEVRPSAQLKSQMKTALCLPSETIILGKDRKTTTRSRTITYNTGFLTQFKWVLKRTFRNLMLNPQTSVAQVGTSSKVHY